MNMQDPVNELLNEERGRVLKTGALILLFSWSGKSIPVIIGVLSRFSLPCHPALERVNALLGDQNQFVPCRREISFPAPPDHLVD